MKGWNSSKGFPYDSYELELFIINLNFHGDDIQKGFFYAAEQSSTSLDDSKLKKDKVNSLKYNIEQVKTCLENNDQIKAKQWLHRVLPI